MPATRTITAAELQHGDTLIHSDQRITITGVVEPSDTWRGYTKAEIDFGVLYLLNDEQLTVVDGTGNNQAWADVIVGPNGSVTDDTNAHHFTTDIGTPVATKLALTIPDTLISENEIAEWIGHSCQRIITAAGPGTTLTVHVGDGR